MLTKSLKLATWTEKKKILIVLKMVSLTYKAWTLDIESGLYVE